MYPSECRVQSRARRDKKVFLSDQCKEIEDNNRTEKTRDVLMKIRDTKGAFHAKMGTIRNRNGMDLTEAEDIKKRCNTQKNCTKKFFMTQIITISDGVIIHLEPYILECEVIGP